MWESGCLQAGRSQLPTATASLVLNGPGSWRDERAEQTWALSWIQVNGSGVTSAMSRASVRAP